MITILIGVSGSGKTTLAKKLLELNPDAIRVNRDDLRKALYGVEQTDTSYYTSLNFKASENRVSQTVDSIMYDALNEGKDLVLDNTHLQYKYITEIIRKFNHLSAIELMFVHGDTHLEFNTFEDRLIERFGGNKESVQYLSRQWQDFKKLKKQLHRHRLLIPQDSPQVSFNKELPDTYIFDIDGNIALKGDRNIFDESLVYLDREIKPVGNVLKALKESGYNIVFLSGRQDSSYEVTKQWLIDKGLWTDSSEMFMRKAKDQRCDSIVKEELLLKYVLPKYNVLGVFDDRIKVCRAWYRLGVFCFNTNQNLINF